MTRRAPTPEWDGPGPSAHSAEATSTVVASLPRPRTDLLRAQALTAAVELLTEEGWDAVTQARVATQAGLGRATVYRYWPDRRQLVRDAVLSANLAVRRQVPASGNLRDDLVTELRNLRRELTSGRLAMVLAALIDRAEWDAELETVKVTVSRYAGRVICRIVAKAISDGQLSNFTDPDDSVSLLLGPLVYRRLVSVEDLTDSFLDSLVDGYLAANAAGV
ncbi:MAG TPA: TetR/AcrR family transcriptional regulator [Jatrophihabitantaceae bacterium]|jgi:AcrR family transcriptional regulator|nr:TetR/AcrR family transcriptional regulator [Jatrophihabitantaceae bacterium]